MPRRQRRAGASHPAGRSIRYRANCPPAFVLQWQAIVAVSLAGAIRSAIVRRMLRYLASRLCIAVLMVLLATLVIFLIANMVPGDPVLTQLGRHRREQSGHGRRVPPQMGPRSAAMGSLLDLPHRPVPWRSRNLDRLAAAGAGGHRAIRAGHGGTLHHRLPARIDRRPAARRGRGNEARYLDRPPGAQHFAGRRIRTDILARLRHARGVLRRAGMGARPRPDQRQHVPAADDHRHHADRRAARRRLGHVLGCRGASGAAVDRAGCQHARPDHPDHARRDAGGAVAGLYPRRARQGSGAPIASCSGTRCPTRCCRW